LNLRIAGMILISEQARRIQEMSRCTEDLIWKDFTQRKKPCFKQQQRFDQSFWILRTKRTEKRMSNLYANIFMTLQKWAISSSNRMTWQSLLKGAIIAYKACFRSVRDWRKRSDKRNW